MEIRYRDVAEFEGWDSFPSFIEELAGAHSLYRVCEVGAGANPALSPQFVQDHGLLYRAIDKSETEIGKSEMNGMSVFDICSANSKLPGAPYDLICSRMTAEHFEEPRHAYANMFMSLAPGGLCVHSFATLYSLPFLLNKLLPSVISDTVLNTVSPRDRDAHDKFKAYYRYCRGPLKSQTAFFETIGFEILEYRGYFGHNYYHLKLPLLHLMERKETQILLRTPAACLTTYSTVVLQRPVLST